MVQLLIAPIEVLTDSRLTDPERRVLLALYSFRGKDTNTVWPSLDLLSERSLIKDITRISKITKSLAGKGWLTKKKKGFTGCNSYKLSIPSNLAQDTNLVPETKLGENAKSNLDCSTKSNLVPETKYKEQTIEQTIEQTKKNKVKTKKIVLPDWIDSEVWAAFIEMRKKIKKPATDYAQELIISKLDKFRAKGFDPCLSLQNSIIAGWQDVFEPKIKSEDKHGNFRDRDYKTGSNLESLDWANG